MQRTLDYTPRERLWMLALAVFGIGINGVFLYGLLFRPDALAGALTNPLAAPFIVETLVLVAVLAYLFKRWGVSRLGWAWFVLLSLLGSMAFAIPMVLLLGRRTKRNDGFAGQRDAMSVPSGDAHSHS